MLKECPNCRELLGESLEECFNCKYNFKLQRVKTEEEEQQERAERQEKERQAQEAKEKEQEKRVQDLKQSRELHQLYLEKINKNPLYEYSVELVPDLSTGVPNYERIRSVLNEYASRRWRLHTMVVNEVGKTSSAVGIGGISAGVNATVDITMMVFERCIEPAKF